MSYKFPFEDLEMRGQDVVEGGGSSLLFSHPLLAAEPGGSAGGTLVIKTGADSVEWGYTLKTRSIPTFGGEVIQILSLLADNMTVSGVVRNYKEQGAIYWYFLNYLKLAGGMGAVTKSLNRNQIPITFRYPARGWSFDIIITDLKKMEIGLKIVTPEWGFTAEIVSENDRYEIGNSLLSGMASVLNANSPIIKNKGTEGIIGFNPDNPFSGALTANPNEFGSIIDERLQQQIASWATDNFSTYLFQNAVTSNSDTSFKSSSEYYSSYFGSDVAFKVGGSGTGTGNTPGGTGEIVYGDSKRVFATTFGGGNDDKGNGSGGYNLNKEENWDSYAELSTNLENSENQPDHRNPDGSVNDYAALGKLPYMTPIKVTYKGKSKILYKRDTGFGGKGPDGKRGTKDDPKIDIWYKASEELGFNGWDYVDIQIGTVEKTDITLVGAPLSASGKEAIKKLQYYINSGKLVLNKTNDHDAVMRGDGIVYGHGTGTRPAVNGKTYPNDRTTFCDEILVCLAYLLDSDGITKLYLESMVGDHGYDPYDHWHGKGMDIFGINGMNVSDKKAQSITIATMDLLWNMGKGNRPVICINAGNSVNKVQSDENKKHEFFMDEKKQWPDAPQNNPDHCNHIHVGYGKRV